MTKFSIVIIRNYSKDFPSALFVGFKDNVSLPNNWFSSKYNAIKFNSVEYSKEWMSLSEKHILKKWNIYYDYFIQIIKN